MAKQSRVNDVGLGICPVHGQVTVVLVTGAETVYANGIPSCVVTSIGMCDCGHTSVAQVGSSTVLIESKPSHRVNDTGEIEGGGTYTVVSGSPDVNVNDN